MTSPLCVDGLKALQAIESVWPQTIVQTCVVLVRASMRYVFWKRQTRGLKGIYRTPEEAASESLHRFEAHFAGDPAVGKVRRDAWDRFVPIPTIRAMSAVAALRRW